MQHLMERLPHNNSSRKENERAALKEALLRELKVNRDGGLAHTGGERSYPSVCERALEVVQSTNVLGNCQDPYIQRQVQCLYDRRIKHAHSYLTACQQILDKQAGALLQISNCEAELARAHTEAITSTKARRDAAILRAQQEYEAAQDRIEAETVPVACML
eukprot:CAMPEP_0198221250 /NCGR_PEP_ID=MMETSP1445-20131203/82865_1 /TAXON_ID=36898 /ORGANISM="Pyramimonas sp., Strain CCMP2087" /LENGTH=160 /DNA_ID=CAMNT_0043899315 /DNA_START=246 /DNA_END=725 /DNA_ORIENTATION=+